MKNSNKRSPKWLEEELPMEKAKERYEGFFYRHEESLRELIDAIPEELLNEAIEELQRKGLYPTKKSKHHF